MTTPRRRHGGWGGGGFGGGSWGGGGGGFAGPARGDRGRSLVELDRPEVMPAEPTEGMTGWADTWMLSSSAPHQNCMLEWMDYSLSADVQAEVAEYYGAAASNTAR